MSDNNKALLIKYDQGWYTGHEQALWWVLSNVEDLTQKQKDKIYTQLASVAELNTTYCEKEK